MNSSSWAEAVSRVGILNSTNDSLKMDAFVNTLPSELLPSLIYVCCLLITGIIGNALACSVYHKKWRKKRKVSTLFILTLAWTDFLNCLATMPFEIALLVNFTSFDYPVLCKVSRWLTYLLNCFSTMTLLGIALDRLFGIRYTFKKALFGVTRCKIYLGFSFLVALITTWPALVLFGTFTESHTKTCLIDDDYVSNQKTIKPFWHGIYLILSIFVVDSIFIIIYCMIGCSIYQRRISPSSFRRDSRISSSFSPKRWSVDSYSCNSKKNNFNRQSCRSDVDENLEDDVFADIPRNPQIQKLYSFKTDSRYNGRFSPKQASPTKPRQFFNSPSRQNMFRAYSFRSSSSSNFSGRNRRFESLSNDSMRFGPRSGTRKTLLMLCMVTAVYILTFLPYCVLVILRYTSPGLYSRLNTIEKNVYQLFIRSYMLSMSTNSIIYSFMNNQFRRECYLVIKSMMYIFRQNHD